MAALSSRRRSHLPVKDCRSLLFPLGSKAGDRGAHEIHSLRQTITLNVGGMEFRSLASNFALLPRTRLAKLMRARNEENIRELCDGYIHGKWTILVQGLWFGGALGSASRDHFPLCLDCSTAALTTPQKVLPIRKLVELKMLDFSDCTRTGISILTSAADRYKVYKPVF